MPLPTSTLSTNAAVKKSRARLQQPVTPSVKIAAQHSIKAVKAVARETLASDRITSHSIPLLLEWWQQRKRLANSRSNLHATLPKGDDLYLRAYYRLMEVYSVVKSGGVQAQTEAVQAFAERESRLLHQQLSDINAEKTLTQTEKVQAREKIDQELTELKCANDWRLQALMNIDADEEALVQQHLSAIENTLTMQARCA
ncbi:MAG: hypothetical protein AAFP03_15545 [Cyanobacteria bacterium J06598_3]